MNPPSLFTACVLIGGTTWYAITLQLAPPSPAVGAAPRWQAATVVGIALAVVGNVVALRRSVDSRA